MKKRLPIIITILILIIVLISAFICLYAYNIKNNQGEINISKLSNIHENMIRYNIYTVTMTLDENNKITTSRKHDVAYVDLYNNGEHTTDVVKDGTMYFLVHDTKRYYKYSNNEELSKLTNMLEELKSMTHTKGREKINNKNYDYEEYKGFYGFMFKYDKNQVNQNIKTRFYFNGDKLEYIKTISDSNEELLKVEILYEEGNSNLYEIPTNYKKGD